MNCTNALRRAMVGILAAVLAVPGLAYGQEKPADQLAGHLFPPELVMQNQRAIDLQPEQRTAISEAIHDLQSRVVELQWELSSANQELVELVRAPRVEEGAALHLLDRMLGIEQQVKRTHMATLIRIKNTLTPEQQARLRELMRKPPQ